ncbi:MAG: protein-glutamate O-methyltransferase CheR [Planctomycetaceae bacterium]
MNLTQEEFNHIRKFIHDASGLALASDKQYLVRTRLEPVARRYHLKSFAEIIRRLQDRSDGHFRDEVIDAMTTNETSFNRDGHPFDELRRSILPRLIQTLDDRKTRSGIPFPRIRIWSVAASTGQEPYSIAMAILDFLRATPGTSWTSDHFWILGTDISERTLQIARAGLYSDWEIDRGISMEHKTKYFSPRDNQWLISPAIRKMVDFRRVNVLENVADLAGFDIIFCRNLLIYFDESTRCAVCQKIARGLNPDGLLILGAAEQLPALYDTTFQQSHFGRTIAFVKLS